MQTPKKTASASTSPKGGSLKDSADDPAERKRFNDDDDFDDLDDETLEDLDYDSASRFDDDDDDDF